MTISRARKLLCRGKTAVIIAARYLDGKFQREILGIIIARYCRFVISSIYDIAKFACQRADQSSDYSPLILLIEWFSLYELSLIWLYFGYKKIYCMTKLWEGILVKLCIRSSTEKKSVSFFVRDIYDILREHRPRAEVSYLCILAQQREKIHQNIFIFSIDSKQYVETKSTVYVLQNLQCEQKKSSSHTRIFMLCYIYVRAVCAWIWRETQSCLSIKNVQWNHWIRNEKCYLCYFNCDKS